MFAGILQSLKRVALYCWSTGTIRFLKHWIYELFEHNSDSAAASWLFRTSPVPEGRQFILQTHIQLIKHLLRFFQLVFCLRTKIVSLHIQTQSMWLFPLTSEAHRVSWTHLHHLAVVLHSRRLQSFNVVTSTVIVNQFPTSLGHTSLKHPFLVFILWLKVKSFLNNKKVCLLPLGLGTVAGMHLGSGASSPPACYGSLPTMHHSPAGDKATRAVTASNQSPDVRCQGSTSWSVCPCRSCPTGTKSPCYRIQKIPWPSVPVTWTLVSHLDTIAAFRHELNSGNYPHFLWRK